MLSFRIVKSFSEQNTYTFYCSYIETVGTYILVTLTGQSPPSDLVRELMALPTSLGSLGLINPQGSATEQHETSKRISAPLVDLILQQDHQLLECHSIHKFELKNAQSKRTVLKPCKTSYHLPFNAVWNFTRKRSFSMAVSTTD